jgi:hypothetical protein
MYKLYVRVPEAGTQYAAYVNHLVPSCLTFGFEFAPTFRRGIAHIRYSDCVDRHRI